MTSLQERLFAMQDKQYAAFQAKLAPGSAYGKIGQTEGRQKAIESYRISPEQKEYLRTLKIK